LLVFPAAHNLAKRRRVMTYLSQKYSIPITM